jgi:hypothetical protein
MSVRFGFAVVLFLTVVVSPEPIIFAQGSCEAGVLSQMERESKRFAEDVDESTRGVVNEELTEAAFAAAKDVLKDNTTAQAVLDTREKWNKWKEHVETGKKGLDDVIDCAPNYAFSCLMEQSRQTNAQIRRWLESLAGESAQAVKDKVTKVTSLYRGYVERAFGNTQTSINNYLNNCTAIAEQRIQTRTTTNAPKSGMSAAKIATMAAAIGGAGYATKYALDAKRESDEFLREFGNISTPTSSPVSNTTPTAPAPTAGVRAFDGTYDFEFVRTFPGGQETVRVPRYLIINNGRLTTSENTINGTVDSNGVVNAVGVCPINSEPADWRGQMSANGTGLGAYTCRFGGISRNWNANNRR